ncbi:MAG: quinol:cytochrome C oxidoreductase [Polyangiaceae bacterium]
MAKGSKDSKGTGDGGTGDNTLLAEVGQSLFVKAAAVGVLALGISLFLGSAENDGWNRFSHSYLVAFAWMMTICAGAVWWVTLQNVVNSHWSLVIRRVGELLASNAGVLAILALPVVLPLILGKSPMYLWSDVNNMLASDALKHKIPYLNPQFFAIRFVFYFGFWILLSRFYLNRSVAQDKEAAATAQKTVVTMRRAAGPALIVYAITITFSAIDLVMTLDPRWFSTMFGVYYFASCVMAENASLALTLMWLQSKGRLTSSVTVNHFHDLGKMLFAFTIFWAYIGFSQFMLLWYANIPEETLWFKVRFVNSWGTLAWVLLFGHFVIPFFGLLSRWVKRSRKALAFWCVWQLVMIFLDMYWLVMPTLGLNEVQFKLIDLTCWVGVLSLFIAGLAFRAKRLSLLASNDPRLPDSLAFENI